MVESAEDVASDDAAAALNRSAIWGIFPPGESKSKDTRYLDLHEDDQLDEAQLAVWVKQASQSPGERM